MLDTLIQNLKSAIKATEILYVLENEKPVARLLVEDEKADLTQRFLEEQGLKTAISDFKIDKVSENNKKYSNKGIRLDKNTKGQYLIYVSRSQELAEKAKRAEQENNHRVLGKLLGFPECCIDFFEKRFPQNLESADLTLETLKHSKDLIAPFQTNIAARTFDLGLISHFPCSFNCQPSIEMAKKHLQIIKKSSEEFAKIFEGMLKSAMIYTKNNGVFMLTKPTIKNRVLRYANLYSSANNEFYETLKKAKEIGIINKNRIKIKDKEFRELGFMLFT